MADRYPQYHDLRARLNSTDLRERLEKRRQNRKIQNERLEDLHLTVPNNENEDPSARRFEHVPELEEDDPNLIVFQRSYEGEIHNDPFHPREEERREWEYDRNLTRTVDFNIENSPMEARSDPYGQLDYNNKGSYDRFPSTHPSESIYRHERQPMEFTPNRGYERYPREEQHASFQYHYNEQTQHRLNENQFPRRVDNDTGFSTSHSVQRVDEADARVIPGDRPREWFANEHNLKSHEKIDPWVISGSQEDRPSLENMEVHSEWRESMERERGGSYLSEALHGEGQHQQNSHIESFEETEPIIPNLEGILPVASTSRASGSQASSRAKKSKFNDFLASKNSQELSEDRENRNKRRKSPKDLRGRIKSSQGRRSNSVERKRHDSPTKLKEHDMWDNIAAPRKSDLNEDCLFPGEMNETIESRKGVSSTRRSPLTMGISGRSSRPRSPSPGSSRKSPRRIRKSSGSDRKNHSRRNSPRTSRRQRSKSPKKQEGMKSSSRRRSKSPFRSSRSPRRMGRSPHRRDRSPRRSSPRRSPPRRSPPRRSSPRRSSPRRSSPRRSSPRRSSPRRSSPRPPHGRPTSPERPYVRTRRQDDNLRHDHETRTQPKAEWAHLHHCPCCNSEKHKLEDCQLFREKSADQKWELVNRFSNVCSVCWKTGHDRAVCPSKFEVHYEMRPGPVFNQPPPTHHQFFTTAGMQNVPPVFRANLVAQPYTKKEVIDLTDDFGSALQCSLCHSYGHLRQTCSKVFCTSCQKPGHLTNECRDARACEYCKMPGHSVLSCPIVVCGRCKRQGHPDIACPTVQSKINSFVGDATAMKANPDVPLKVPCFHCGSDGHHSNECPSVQCDKCKEVGHWSTKCPKIMKCSHCMVTGHLRTECPSAHCTKCSGDGHWAGACNKPAQGSANVAAVGKRKSLSEFFFARLQGSGRATMIVDEMVHTWRLARHNEESLGNLIRAYKPSNSTQLRMILLNELVKVPSNSLPVSIEISDLVDITVDYLNQDQVKNPSQAPQKSLPMAGSSAAEHSRKLSDLSRMIDLNVGPPGSDEFVTFKQRLEDMEGLKRFILERTSKVATQFSVGQDYLQEMARLIVKMLASNGFSTAIFKRHIVAYGSTSLEELIKSKIKLYNPHLPPGFDAKFIVSFVSDFADDYRREF